MAKKPHKDTSKRQEELQEKKDDLQQNACFIRIYNDDEELLSDFDKALKKIMEF